MDCEYDWKKWLERLNSSKYDIMLLDIMLPWLDGIQVCKQARKITEMPIIMITAKHQMEDKMEWFDCGADDYITKPFELVELLARIKAITKRLNKYFSFKFKNIEVVPDKKKILKDWQEVKLTLKEFNIIEYLLQNYWFAVSRTDIIEYIWWWDSLFEWDDKLDVYISNIRKKLDKGIIQTVKWYWYKIEKS